MGTRGTVKVYDNSFSKNEFLVSVYTQYDAYPSGLGEEIKSILNNGKVEIINGIGSNQSIPTHFNGMGCMAAYLVGKLKGDGIGTIYLSTEKDSQQYNYSIYNVKSNLYMKIIDFKDTLIYDGKLSEFDSKKLNEE